METRTGIEICKRIGIGRGNSMNAGTGTRLGMEACHYICPFDLSSELFNALSPPRNLILFFRGSRWPGRATWAWCPLGVPWVPHAYVLNGREACGSCALLNHVLQPNVVWRLGLFQPIAEQSALQQNVIWRKLYAVIRDNFPPLKKRQGCDIHLGAIPWNSYCSCT